MRIKLLEETISVLNEYDKTLDDVIFIQGEDFQITVDNFETVAKNTYYNNGYGAQHVATDLVLVGKDWWLERGEYDGSEWWEFKSIPKRKDETQSITKLGNGMWDTISEMNMEK